MVEEDMIVIADLITKVIKEGNECFKEVKAKVKELTDKYPLPY